MSQACYSSEDLRKSWNYAVESDFHPISDPSLPLSTTVVGLNSSSRSILLTGPPEQKYNGSCVNYDGRRIARSSGAKIYVFNVSTGTHTVLAGHLGDVESMCFVPHRTDRLVTSVSMDYDHSDQADPTKPEIIVWNLSDFETTTPNEDPVNPDSLAGEALEAIRQTLKRHDAFELDNQECSTITSTLSTMLERFKTYRLVPPSSRLIGRIEDSFQSPIFNNAGTVLIYLPGPRPRSNGDHTWDIVLHPLDGREDIILKGHRDAIMWIGFSPNDTIVASVCWDGTIRVWDAVSGAEKWKYTTNKQNWAGVFSPDGKRFLATDGSGSVRVWDTDSGVEVGKYEKERSGWRRAVDWSPDGRWVAVGGEESGTILLFDMAQETIDGRLIPAQKHQLCVHKADLEEDLKGMLASMLSVHTVKFLPASAGLVLVHMTYGSPGMEVVNLDTGGHLRIVPEDDSDAGFSWAYIEMSKELMIISGDKVGYWSLP